MCVGSLLVPNEEMCGIIPQGKCRLHILQHFSIDWEIIGKCLVGDSLFLARRAG